MISKLLVDLDGTLLGSNERRIRAEFFIGALWRMRKVASFRTSYRALRAIRLALESPPNGMKNDLRAVRAFAGELGLSDEAGRELLESLVSEMFPLFGRHVYPIEGAVEFIGWARERFPLVLATNPVWLLKYVEKRLEWAGVSPDVFSSITHAASMTACKPRVEYYNEILAQQGADARECLLIGNDLRKDLPATAAGIRVYILGEESMPRPIPVAAGAAPAWSGNYKALREALEAGSLC